MGDSAKRIAEAVLGFRGGAVNPRSGVPMQGDWFSQDQQLLGNRLRTRFQSDAGENYYLDPFGKNGGYWLQSPSFPQEAMDMISGNNPSHFPPDIVDIVRKAGNPELAKQMLLQAGINPYKQESF